MRYAQQNTKNYKHFTKDERNELSILLKRGYSLREIAGALGRNPSSISREISRNTVNGQYDPVKAQYKAYVKRLYSKYQGMKIRENSEIERYVKEKMKLYWSPEQIAGRLKLETQGRLSLKPDTIYKYLYSAYGQRLCPYLKSKQHGRKKRKSPKAAKQLIPNRTWIDERPEYINSREYFGHFEGDTMGRSKYASNQTLVVARERKSRKLFAEKVARLKYAIDGFKSIFSKLYALSLTLDNGVENIHYEELNILSYFCRPYSSWQKGSVEQGISLVREFIPKKSDLRDYSDKDIAVIIDRINNTPMKCLGWKTPNEVFNEHFPQTMPQLTPFSINSINLECCI